MTPELLVDALLALTLLLLAVRLLFHPELFASAVLFVAFGLTMALVWVRLAAPDVALAEAAVGAGLTGALILRAAGQMPSGGRLVPVRLFTTTVVVSLGLALALTLITVLWGYRWPGPGLGEEVRAGAEELGLDQRVTSVLLVFRGYDTWLELAVLLSTVLAVMGSKPAYEAATRRIREGAGLLLTTYVRLLLPVAVIVAGVIVWHGTEAPGGAFQGAAVVGAAMALGYLAGLQVFRHFRGLRIRLLTSLAVALPALLTLPALLGGRPLFTYPAGELERLVLTLEVAIALSVSFTLASLFAGTEPAEAETEGSSESNTGEANSTNEANDGATVASAGTNEAETNEGDRNEGETNEGERKAGEGNDSDETTDGSGRSA